MAQESGKSKIANNIEELIGNTPLLRASKAHKIAPLGRWAREIRQLGKAPEQLRSQLLLKLEFFNPGGSVKDRIAKTILDAAEKRGDIKPGATIVEATSGNTGAGLALMAVSRGYKAVLCMPDKMSAEKINSLRAFGAKVVVCPSNVPPDHPDYYCEAAKRIAKEAPNGFLADQYFNDDNPKAHYETTGPEIWDQCGGEIDLFVAGIGTGGTISGTAKYLREKNPDLKVVGVDPKGSIYSELIRTGKEGPFEGYLVEGIGEDMIPSTIDLKCMDDVVTIWDDESFMATRLLAESEGVLVGGSCGSAYLGALDYLRVHEANGGAPLNCVVLLPDSGSRYLSKVFNDQWLSTNKMPSSWGKFTPGGQVEYLGDAKEVTGV